MLDAGEGEDVRDAGGGSYEEVYRAEYARLIRVAFMLSGSNEVAEDVVQDAFVRLYTRFDVVADAGSYLYRSVVNGCWSRHRHLRVVERLRHLTSSNGVSIDEVDETAYLLERLAPRQRTVVVLRYYADLSLGDIAEVLGVTTGTVKSTLHRALGALREVVEP